ncbi:MAG: hypothetical protein QXM77_07090 [Candidatus Nitrosocaldus sp.]
MSKTPLLENLKNSNTVPKRYVRDGTILYDESNNAFIFCIGRKGSKKKGYARFIITVKAINDIERFKMLREAIEGTSNITIGDPCMIVKKGNRYFLHISVSKNIDTKALNDRLEEEKKEKKEKEEEGGDKIRIVGVDLGLSRLTTIFCIEVYPRSKEFKLIKNESIDGSKQFINALRQYEVEKSRLQQDKMQGKENKKKKVSRFKYTNTKDSYIIANREGESKVKAEVQEQAGKAVD